MLWPGAGLAPDFDWRREQPFSDAFVDRAAFEAGYSFDLRTPEKMRCVC